MDKETNMTTRLVFTDSFPYEYHNYLDKLEAKERKVVVSFFGLAGKPKLTVEEIAEVLRDPGIDSNKIRNQLSLAMGKLRDAHDKEKIRKFHTTCD
jgi:DNA-directed RNA polymerase sigma subunit (sigma70/sigma32)